MKCSAILYLSRKFGLKTRKANAYGAGDSDRQMSQISVNYHLMSFERKVPTPLPYKFSSR